MVSFTVQHRLAQLMKEVSAAEGQTVAVSTDELAFLLRGEVNLFFDGRLIERVGPGGFWGEAGVLGEGAELLQVRAQTPCTYAVIPGSILADIPIVQWKLQETCRRRLLAFRADFRFEWKEIFAVGVREIDGQHQRLFSMVNALAELPETSAGHAERLRLLGEIVPFARLHFDTEEALMRTHGYPELDRHRSEHEQLFASAQKAQSNPPSEPGSLADFLKDWLVNHTLQEDRKLGPFLNSRGVR
jgi:hemerythrin